jgi:hypothetical protein
MASTSLSKATRSFATDFRNLEVTEVCGLGDWLTRYIRLELDAPRQIRSEFLIEPVPVLQPESVGDLGVFGVED